MSIANRKAEEQLMDAIGNVDEQYIREYIEFQNRTPNTGKAVNTGRSGRARLTVALAAIMVLLFGSISFAAVSAIGHFLTNLTHEREAILKNFSEIEASYALPVGGTQECNGVKGTLNSAVLEDHYLLLNYTFDWSGLEEAQDGSFHTWFLPWFFYISEGDTVICKSEYTQGLHTQAYPVTAENDFSQTHLYCIDLGDIEGQSLVGRELTVRLLYAADGDGFVYTFTPESCFTDKEWNVGKTYRFGENEIILESVRESALYVTLFIDCDTIGRTTDEFQFILSDELGNDYTVYPYENNDINGYWFTKPEVMGKQLNLKVIHSRLVSDSVGRIIDDSYDVLYEIPVELP